MRAVANAEIRIATEADLPSLKWGIKPSFGRSIQVEFDDQEQGQQSIFIALIQGTLVGSGFLRWMGPRDETISTLFPDTPEIFRLDVDEQRRSQGIGSALIAVMEEEARRRGYTRLGLGVAHENPRALALYERVGFERTAITSYYDEYKYQIGDGPVETARDLCRFLTKPIS